MLTSTYTLVALSVEQARARLEVELLLERCRPGAWWGRGPAQRQFEQACESLRRVYENCHWRKLDKFGVPALRRAGAAATGLLDQLESLSRSAAEARAAAQACAEEGDPACLAEVERCCALLLERLAREEHELLPLARTVIPGEAWFSIANQMLAHDAHQHEARGGGGGPGASGAGLAKPEYSARQDVILPMVH